MADNILDSYFVKLSALPDTSSFTKFAVTLKQADSLVDLFSTKTIKHIAEVEAAAVGSFAAIGISMVALADKAAMTDQQYRLFGLHMLMNKDSARAMQMSLDDLGATIDEVAFDPELNKRFQELYERNMRLGKLLGNTFDKNMYSIRDLRMEYKKLTDDLEFFKWATLNDLFEKLGFSSGDLDKKLKGINDWFESEMPTWADKMSDDFIPVWQDSKTVVKDFGNLLKDAGGEFTFLVGVLTDDKSIQDTQFNIENLTKAFVDLIDKLTEAVLSFQLVGKIGVHFSTGFISHIKGYWEALQGNYKEANKFFGIEDKEMNLGVQDIKDLWNSSSGNWKKNPDFSGILEHQNDLSSRPTGVKPSGISKIAPMDLMELLNGAGIKYDVNPALLRAVISVEDAPLNVNATNPSSSAQGLMQLLKGTRRQYGVTNGFDAQQNVFGGAHYLADLLKKYDYNVTLALAAYKAGPGNVDKFGGVPDLETRNYVNRVLREFVNFSKHPDQLDGSVSVGQVNIYVPHDLPDKDWKSFVQESMKDIISDNARKTMAQTAGGPYH